MKNLFRRLFGSEKEKQIHPENKEIGFSEKEIYPNPKTIKESEIQKFIKNSSVNEVEKWFNHYKAKGHYFFDSIYYAVQNKIASTDDDYFIEQIKGMDSEGVKEFLREEKKEGTFFSDKVYDFAMRKMNEEKNDKYIELIENSTPEKVLTWHLKQDEKGGFDYLDKAVEQKAHDKIFSIIESGKVSKRYRKKFFEYIFYSSPPKIEEIMKSEIYLQVLGEQLKEADENQKGLYCRRIGEAYELKQNYKSAIEFYSKALSYANENMIKGIEAQKLGDCQMKAGIIEEGIENLTLAAQLQPNQEAKIYRRIGEYFEDKGELSNTVLYFEKAIEANPKIGVKKKLTKYKQKLKEE
jgi:tetratricopeptide (TPR) repeat protein